MRALPLVSVATAIGTLLVTGNVLAQQAAVAADTGMAAPAGAVAGNSDHDAMVGRLGIGYLGRRSVAMGAAGPVDAMTPAATVDAPVVGVRIWLNPMLGLDAGLGFVTTSGSSQIEAPGAVAAQADHPSTLGFILHGGVPLSLAADNHFSFQVIPELNIGYASQGVEDAAGNSTDHSGFHMDIGGRAGAEIHFGFMGIPQLSLQGSVGLRFDYDSTSTDTTTVGVGTQTASWSGLQISTTTYDNPWNIFISNVAAIYYF